MQKRQEVQQKSRLGLLLIEKGLINRRQLDEALRLQSETNLRLGEVMVRQGWLTHRQLQRALKKQSRYRLIAAISAMLLGPLQPFMGSAHASVEQAPIVSQEELGQRIGMKAMDEESMGEVTAQGLQNGDYDKLVGIINGTVSDQDAGETSVVAAFESLLPGLNLLTDYEISDVEYHDPNGPRTTLNADGSLSVQVPKRIGQIAFRNLNVLGAEGPAMGDLFINDIRLTEGSSITLRFRE
ncbi:hypothetical protein [Thalassolituus oleivorans]|uniref:hypothetical protein n=1 Tax=Thalassolituus oleivorans TaxID=187493 RepID=UPI001CE337DC|nr:hypothetical protein [Thalassolituus oleivorans]MCA6129126.1 hypothetical protein [Thalassolituus oleivorans 4BN06-13]